jgi:anti-sigma factor RsiW
MNTKRNIPSDEELTAFIDGELVGEDAARIEAMVEADEKVAERLDYLARASLPFKEAFAPLLDAAPQAKLQSMLSAIPAAKPVRPLAFVTRRGFLGAVAASVVAGIAVDRAVIGVGASLSTKDESTEWRAVVAEYISLYTPETLAGPVPSKEVQTAQLARFDGSLGLQLSPEQVALPDVDFKRAQILQYDGKPLAQIAYLDPETGPMALCIVASDVGAKAPDIEGRKGMNVVYWSSASHAFMLIGHASVDRMTAIADAVRSKISV